MGVRKGDCDRDLLGMFIFNLESVESIYKIPQVYIF